MGWIRTLPLLVTEAARSCLPILSFTCLWCITSSNFELTQQILLASASIPGAFPPVLIEVEVGDERFDEEAVRHGV